MLVLPQIQAACSCSSRIAQVGLAMLAAPSSRRLPKSGFRSAAIGSLRRAAGADAGGVLREHRIALHGQRREHDYRAVLVTRNLDSHVRRPPVDHGAVAQLVNPVCRAHQAVDFTGREDRPQTLRACQLQR